MAHRCWLSYCCYTVIATDGAEHGGARAFRVAVEAWMDVTRALVETERVVERESARGCCG